MFIRFFLVFLLASCSSVDTKSVQGKTDAELLYNQAKLLASKKSYTVALEKIKTIRSKYPYSYFATPAELLGADILFKQGNYLEAATSYHVFRELHPRYQEMDYVLFMIAQSYFKQMPSTADRDISMTQRAIRSYGEMLARFPNSPNSKEAVKNLEICKKMVVDKEKNIADFYFKTKNYEAARYRYLHIANRFKEPDISNYSKVKIVETSYLLKDYPMCLNYIKMFATTLSKESTAVADGYVTKCSKALKK